MAYADLCRVLAAIGGPLTIETTWALTRPRAAVPTVSFTAEELAALADAALTRRP